MSHGGQTRLINHWICMAATLLGLRWIQAMTRLSVRFLDTSPTCYPSECCSIFFSSCHPSFQCRSFVYLTGSSNELETQRYVSGSDDQDVTVTLFPAKALIVFKTPDFTSTIARPVNADFAWPVIFMSPGNAAQLLSVRIRTSWSDESQ